jgi:Flp pilus assembly protein TadB
MAKDFEITAKGAADQNSSSRNDEALKKLIEAWNSKSAKAAKRVGTFGFMAAALAACGGAGSDGGNAEKAIDELGSRLIDRQSQNRTVAARATAERKVLAHLS